MNKRAESIDMVAMRFGYYPGRFRWLHREIEVVRVERVWTVRRQWPRPVRERVYAVRCAQGSFELCHDLLRNVWRIVRAPAQDAPVPRAFRGMRSNVYGQRLAVVR
jgi:hypothetical protein